MNLKFIQPEPKREPLNTLQIKIINFVKRYVKMNGVCPTRNEIAYDLDTSAAVIRNNLKIMERKGYVQLKKGAGRYIKLI